MRVSCRISTKTDVPHPSSADFLAIRRREAEPRQFRVRLGHQQRHDHRFDLLGEFLGDIEIFQTTKGFDLIDGLVNKFLCV